MREVDRALAQAINRGDRELTGQSLKLRRGLVSAVGSVYATVTIAESEAVDVPVYRNVTVKVGDVVDILLDGPSPRVIGVVDTAPVAAVTPAQGLLGYIRIDSSNTSGEGRYNGTQSALTETMTVTTTVASTGLYCRNMPVLANRIIRVRFHLAAQGPVNAAQETYYYAMTAYNGSGTYAINHEMRHQPSGGNAPSPEGEFFLYTTSTATQLSVRIDAKVSSGTLTVYRFIASQASARAHMTVEDLGQRD